MRNLSECQAEVFRRSEKRINARKRRRNHMLVACVPVVLCIALILPVFFPNHKAAAPGIEGSPESVQDGVTVVVNESLSEPAVSVTVLGEEFSNVLVDDTAVHRVCVYLSSFGTRGTETNEAVDDKVVDENAEDVSGTVADSSAEGYTITLNIPQEEKTTYYLTGNRLENLTTNQIYTLSEKQVKELRSLLGITHP